jgi:competence protein ComEC
MEMGDVRLEVVHPPAPEWERQKIRNDDSIVLRLRYGDVEFLLTGDAGPEFEQRWPEEMDVAPVRVIKVGHHGSRTSSSEAFLSRYRPDVALISAGRGNLFGHPAPEVLARLQRIGAEIFRTDRDGAIILETDGRSVDVRTMRGQHWTLRVLWVPP